MFLSYSTMFLNRQVGRFLTEDSPFSYDSSSYTFQITMAVVTVSLYILCVFVCVCVFIFRGFIFSVN